MEDFMEIWEILGLEPTEDISAIKRSEEHTSELQSPY